MQVVQPGTLGWVRQNGYHEGLRLREGNVAAWALGGDNIAGTSYANWVAGYGTTAAIAVTSAENFGSDQATVSISATQTDGSVRNYSGTYTVQNGVIVSAQITQQ